jgi:3-phosphoshikimate 1-carboxyvinyltransferase
MTSYPDQLEILPLTAPPCAVVRVPGSKSLTNRALVLAALAEPSEFGATSILEGALQSEDTEVMVDCLRRLGVPVAADWEKEKLVVTCMPRASWTQEADLFVGNSGTTMRFLTAMLALGPGRCRLDGIPRMRERPMGDLLIALQQLGVTALSEEGNGCPPVLVRGGGWQGGEIRLKGDISSQFLSALLMVAPLAQRETIFQIDGGLVSIPYVRMTALLMAECGIEFAAPVGDPATWRDSDFSRIAIPGGQDYPARLFTIEPDASAASYFFAAAAMTQGEITVTGRWHPQMQGDVQFVRLLEAMGCLVDVTPRGITVQGTAQLQGIEVDMNAISDTVMTLAAVACVAQGPTTIRNVAHIRHKESDRLHALATELRKVGAEVEEWPDGLRISPRPLHGATLETYNDHRLAMSLALLGLCQPGIVLNRPGCVAKTYPRFFADLALLRATAPI